MGTDGGVPPYAPYLARWASSPNPLFFLSGIAPRRSIPPFACIPVPTSWSDLIVARVYACVVG